MFFGEHPYPEVIPPSELKAIEELQRVRWELIKHVMPSELRGKLQDLTSKAYPAHHIDYRDYRHVPSRRETEIAVHEYIISRPNEQDRVDCPFCDSSAEIGNFNWQPGVTKLIGWGGYDMWERHHQRFCAPATHLPEYAELEEKRWATYDMEAKRLESAKGDSAIIVSARQIGFDVYVRFAFEGELFRVKLSRNKEGEITTGHKLPNIVREETGYVFTTKRRVPAYAAVLAALEQAEIAIPRRVTCKVGDTTVDCTDLALRTLQAFKQVMGHMHPEPNKVTVRRYRDYREEEMQPSPATIRGVEQIYGGGGLKVLVRHDTRKRDDFPIDADGELRRGGLCYNDAESEQIMALARDPSFSPTVTFKG